MCFAPLPPPQWYIFSIQLWCLCSFWLTLEGKEVLISMIKSVHKFTSLPCHTINTCFSTEFVSHYFFSSTSPMNSFKPIEKHLQKSILKVRWLTLWQFSFKMGEFCAFFEQETLLWGSSLSLPVLHCGFNLCHHYNFPNQGLWCHNIFMLWWTSLDSGYNYYFSGCSYVVVKEKEII